MKITLESGDFGWDYLITAKGNRSRLIQVDWDYPGVASTFGWSPSKVPPKDEDHVCSHEDTDGTVDCSCGVKAGEFIASAQEWLDEHIGESVDDPGYFSEDE